MIEVKVKLQEVLSKGFSDALENYTKKAKGKAHLTLAALIRGIENLRQDITQASKQIAESLLLVHGDLTINNVNGLRAALLDVHGLSLGIEGKEEEKEAFFEELKTRTAQLVEFHKQEQDLAEAESTLTIPELLPMPKESDMQGSDINTLRKFLALPDDMRELLLGKGAAE